MSLGKIAFLESKVVITGNFFWLHLQVIGYYHQSLPACHALARHTAGSESLHLYAAKRHRGGAFPSCRGQDEDCGLVKMCYREKPARETVRSKESSQESVVSAIQLSPIHGEFQSLCYSSEFVLAQGKGTGLFYLRVLHPGPQVAPIQNSKWAIERIGMEYVGGQNHLKTVPWVLGPSIFKAHWGVTLITILHIKWPSVLGNL